MGLTFTGESGRVLVEGGRKMKRYWIFIRDVSAGYAKPVNPGYYTYSESFPDPYAVVSALPDDGLPAVFDLDIVEDTEGQPPVSRSRWLPLHLTR